MIRNCLCGSKAPESSSCPGKLSYGEFRFLSIDALIAAKTAAGRAHDMRAVGHLMALRERMSGNE